MKGKLSYAKVYRFNDHVAVYLANADEGVTVYLSPDEAERMCTAVHHAATDCAVVKFSKSNLESVEIVPDERNTDPHGG